jgi:cold shock CspA family protein
MEGTIKDFDSIRKLGHIGYDGGKTIPVHVSAFKAFIQTSEMASLVGKAVVFAIGEYDGRPSAKTRSVEFVDAKEKQIVETKEPEDPMDLTEFIPYDEQIRLARMAKREKRHIAECYVGKHLHHNERKERQRKLNKIFDDAFDDCND